MRKLLMLPLAVVAMVALNACSTQYATSTADTHTCVYDGSERGGQKLKFQIAPGQESKEIDDNDIAISIPASNRFFMASRNDTIRDPLAPLYYETFAAKNVKVQIEGQVRFRFNLSNACEWFAKHGRRDAADGKNLGFNARGPDALNAGWFHFLSENFGVTMQQATDQVTNNYDAFAMVFHYPTNADETGAVPAGQAPGDDTDTVIGHALGQRFTQLLNANLGGQYFCGIDSGQDQANPCPDMLFQVIAVHTSDPSLEAGRQQVEKTKQDLQNAQLEGQLQQQQAAQIAASSQAQQQILQAQADAAHKQAEIDNAKCIVLAQQGLDCEGHRPAIIVGGQAN